MIYTEAKIKPPTVKVGDIVKPKYGHTLTSGPLIYQEAVVVSLNPFVLVSKNTSARWGLHDPKNFIVNSRASKPELTACMKRL